MSEDQLIQALYNVAQKLEAYTPGENKTIDGLIESFVLLVEWKQKQQLPKDLLSIVLKAEKELLWLIGSEWGYRQKQKQNPVPRVNPSDQPQQPRFIPKQN